VVDVTPNRSASIVEKITSNGGLRRWLGFLASDEASYVNGQTLYVNDGAR
jgi:NAD(P)-dependent dehydrogenase (short-subunit alcohol dehydrogenase family)